MALMVEFIVPPVPPVVSSRHIQSGKGKNLGENDTLHDGFRDLFLKSILF